MPQTVPRFKFIVDMGEYYSNRCSIVDLLRNETIAEDLEESWARIIVDLLNNREG